ncbi:N-acetyltransferase [Thalassobacillus devorans]|uniref:N-acetyltransferase n=1 Tax=Thalassobacillus devorans TaxID=279813 RepID=A0ABQ1PQW4_9BACI|nr:GNAT family N-acetyltransferase [Thalassobacillus devorans]NIK30616.1 GNAT superfamily N-acetyltransferase [Thalassobacillus devorans]GGD01519.1 N-acetyltransferase [Thalassobacillus devorans]
MIREAMLEDAGELAKLVNLLGYPTTIKEMSARFAKIKMKTDYQTYVYEESGQLNGMIGMIHSFRYEKNESYVRVVAAIVEEEHQGRGIGKELFQRAEQWGKARGAASIILNSGNRPERQTTHHIYEKWGYRKKSTGFYKPIS